jgi:hypothetical protein
MNCSLYAQRRHAGNDLFLWRLMISFYAPLMWIDKAATWDLAQQLGGAALVDLIRTDTHTCYLGERGALHDWGYGCGKCPACELRARVSAVSGSWLTQVARVGATDRSAEREYSPSLRAYSSREQSMVGPY